MDALTLFSQYENARNEFEKALSRLDQIHERGGNDREAHERVVALDAAFATARQALKNRLLQLEAAAARDDAYGFALSRIADGSMGEPREFAADVLARFGGPIHAHVGERES